VTQPQPSGEEGPMAISIARANGTTPGELRVLIHSKEGWELDSIPLESVDQWGGCMQALRRKRPERLGAAEFTQRVDDGLKDRLAKYEQRMISLCHKFGVLYSKDGQNDELEIYNNEQASPAFQEFLEFLGSKVELQGFSGYSGGLDIKANTTGTHSIYTRFGEQSDCEIMFHPLTYLPFSANDPQQIERKRHIGNDVVVVIFREGNASAPFSPASIQSQFNHVFVVVSPVEDGCDGCAQYKVAIARKEGIPSFGPQLPPSALVRKDEDGRRWMLTKLINAERAALRSPTFQNKFTNVRKFQLQYILQDAKLADERQHTLDVLQQTTKFSRSQLEQMLKQLDVALNGEDCSTDRKKREQLTEEEFCQIFANICSDWKGHENKHDVRCIFRGAKLNGSHDHGLSFVDFVQLLDSLAFDCNEKRLGLLQRVLSARHQHDGEKEGCGVLEAVVPADLLSGTARLSFAEFKGRVGNDAALLDLFSINPLADQVALVPKDFVCSQPDWWTASSTSRAPNEASPPPQSNLSLLSAQYFNWNAWFKAS